MTERSVIHDTFVIERIYPASSARVFAAFASRETKDAWADTGDIAGAEPITGPVEFDFRVGGHERFGNVYQGVRYTYDATYYDIVPDQRLVYSYEMYADGVRSSVSVATIDDKIRRILRVEIEFGWLDRDQTDYSIPKLNPDAAHVALQESLEGMVLLKNQRLLVA